MCGYCVLWANVIWINSSCLAIVLRGLMYSELTHRVRVHCYRFKWSNTLNITTLSSLCNVVQLLSLRCNVIQSLSSRCNVVQSLRSQCNVVQSQSSRCNVAQSQCLLCNVVQSLSSRCNVVQSLSSPEQTRSQLDVCNPPAETLRL